MIAKVLGTTNLKPTHVPDRVGEVRDSVADISQAQSLIGYQPATALVEGLDETVRWYADQHADEPNPNQQAGDQ